MAGLDEVDHVHSEGGKGCETSAKPNDPKRSKRLCICGIL